MRHDPATEAQCFDELIRRSSPSFSDDALDMTDDLATYLRPGRPRPFSPWRALFWRMGDLRGKRVLDLGCGTGASSVILAAKGAKVTAVDISSESIRVAQRRAMVNGFPEVEHRVGSAYELPFDADGFDVVVMCAVLHHLDLARVRAEVHRVMDPRGEGWFLEPVARSAAVTALRDFIPVARNCETPDERELTDADIDAFCAPFAARDLTYMGLVASRLERFVPAHLAWLMERVYETDALVLDFAFTHNLADCVVGRVSKSAPRG